jgi:hypothetical protein
MKFITLSVLSGVISLDVVIENFECISESLHIEKRVKLRPLQMTGFV